MAKTNGGGRIVDLNKMRAARLEELGEGPVVQFGDATLKCPPEIPFTVVEALDQSDVDQATGRGAATALKNGIRYLLGEEQFKTFMAQEPSSADMTNFVEAVFESYGVNAGESSASTKS